MSLPARIGISVNLPTGATYDLLVVRTPEGYPQGQLRFELEDAPRKITGIQKVAQTFLRVLLTTKGSDVLKRNLGTDLPNMIIGSNRRTDDPKFSIELSSAVRDAEEQCRGILNSSTADRASQLDKIEFLGHELVGDAVSVYLQIITKAGETASIAVPFPELDLKMTTNG